MNPNTEVTKAHSRLDAVCAGLCSLVPIGVVIGTVVFEGFIALAGLLWIIRCLVSRHNPFSMLKKHELFIALLAFNLMIYLSVMVNGPGDKGLLNDLAYLRFIIFAAALIDISKRISIQKYMIFGLISAVALGGLNSLSAHTIGYDIIGKPLMRYSGKGNEAARIAGVCTFAGPFFLAWSVFDRELMTRYKWMLFFLFTICIPLVVKTGIRTLIITLSIAVLWVLFLYIKKRASAKWTILPALIGIALAVFIVKTNRIRLYSFWDRIHMWSVNVDIWSEHPAFGVGPFSYSSAYESTMKRAESDTYAIHAPDGKTYNNQEVTTHAHNLLLMLLTTTGLCGTLSFIWLLFKCIRKIIQNRKGWRIGLITWPVVLLVIGLTGYNIYDPWYQSLFTFFLILIGTPIKRPVTGNADIFSFNRKMPQAEISQ